MSSGYSRHQEYVQFCQMKPDLRKTHRGTNPKIYIKYNFEYFRHRRLLYDSNEADDSQNIQSPQRSRDPYERKYLDDIWMTQSWFEDFGLKLAKHKTESFNQKRKTHRHCINFRFLSQSGLRRFNSIAVAIEEKRPNH